MIGNSDADSITFICLLARHGGLQNQRFDMHFNRLYKYKINNTFSTVLSSAYSI